MLVKKKVMEEMEVFSLIAYCRLQSNNQLSPKQNVCKTAAENSQ